MTKKVITTEKREFVGKDGNPVTLYRVFVIDDNGAVGSVYTNKYYPNGSDIKFKLATNKDGALKLAVVSEK